MEHEEYPHDKAPSMFAHTEKFDEGFVIMIDNNKNDFMAVVQVLNPRLSP